MNSLPGINEPFIPIKLNRDDLILSPIATDDIPLYCTQFDTEVPRSNIVAATAKLANKITWRRQMRKRYGRIISRKPAATNELITNALMLNFFEELLALWCLNCSDNFQKARTLLFETISKIMLYGDDYPQDIIEDVKNAGTALYESDGMSGMRDPLVWMFIPRGLHSEIECYWDGIGDWKW